MFETPEEFRRRAGSIELGRSYAFQTKGGVIGQFVVAAVLVAGVVGAAFWLLWPRWLPILIGVAAFVPYCALSYFVRARPNHDHVTGRFLEKSLSDDVNWFLIWLAIVLAPGRFIAEGIVDGVRLLAVGRLPHEAPSSGEK